MLFWYIYVDACLATNCSACERIIVENFGKSSANCLRGNIIFRESWKLLWFYLTCDCLRQSPSMLSLLIRCHAEYCLFRSTRRKLLVTAFYNEKPKGLLRYWSNSLLSCVSVLNSFFILLISDINLNSCKWITQTKGGKFNSSPDKSIFHKNYIIM